MNKKEKVVFLDRDGVINKERKDYVKSVKELEIFSDVWMPIKKLKDSGFLLIVITNQSAINRGLTTDKNLKKIHQKIQEYLIKNKTSIDGFYYCPHTPDEECNCRKPKPGMILKAADDFKIDLKSSWFIGDNETDIDAAKNAGCKYLKINENFSLKMAVEKIINS